MVRQLLQRIRKFRQDKALILMYHQVCERSDDPWELAVHPGNFYEQLDYLRKNFQVVPVADLANGITRGKVGSNAVAITFDDGFRDNYTTAAPILDWFNMPAAFYVSTRSILEERIYWWEVLQHV
ncbi:MAG TPA: polysaccharide deacetylase family protein, partial [Chryseosolibacter sp.]|nr:polysaccharide deacetylase family protein [Chryseosolibacter sp.]